MLYIFFDRDLSGMTEEKAVELFGKPVLEFPEEKIQPIVDILMEHPEYDVDEVYHSLNRVD